MLEAYKDISHKEDFQKFYIEDLNCGIWYLVGIKLLNSKEVKLLIASSHSEEELVLWTGLRSISIENVIAADKSNANHACHPIMQ